MKKRNVGLVTDWTRLPVTLTTSEVANILRVSDRTVQLLADKGELPAVRVGKHWRFTREVIRKWVTGS